MNSKLAKPFLVPQVSFVSFRKTLSFNDQPDDELEVQDCIFLDEVTYKHSHCLLSIFELKIVCVCHGWAGEMTQW